MAVEPYACLIVVVVRHWDHFLTPRVTQARTQAVAHQIAAVTAAAHPQPGTTLAVLGHLYHADQLCTAPVLEDFARYATQGVTTRATDSSLSVLPLAGAAYPQCPTPWRLSRDPTEVPQARGGYVRIVGLPCALVGPAAGMPGLLSPPLSPVPCPGLTTTLSQLLNVEAAQLFFVSMQRRDTLASWVKDTRGSVRAATDHADATLAAHRRTAPVRATAVVYGTDGRLAYLTLTITDAVTRQVLRTYRYHADDFPGQSADADRFLQQLSFAWGAVDYELLPTVQPVRYDATGALVVYEPPTVSPVRYTIPRTREHSH